MPSPSPNSIIDRVDDSNRKIGLVRREDVFAQKAGFRTVHVFVCNAAGDILLQKIGPANHRSAFRWGSSVAGYLHAGEKYANAARRRMREEIGLSVRIRRFGTRRMADEGATKFVGLFETEAETATIQDHAAVEDLRFWSPDAIRRHLKEHPDDFTKTFRELFEFWQGNDSNDD